MALHSKDATGDTDTGLLGAGRFDAVVVGAGLAGSVAACRAQELGCRTLLIDKSEEPSSGGIRACRAATFTRLRSLWNRPLRTFAHVSRR